MLLEPLTVDSWLKGPDKPAWESQMRAQVAYFLPHLEVVFGWECADPCQVNKSLGGCCTN